MSKKTNSSYNEHNWSPVNNQLPEKGENCWIRTKYGEIEMDLFDGDWWVNQGYGDVTHWRYVIKPTYP